jgi:serine protease Do
MQAFTSQPPPDDNEAGQVKPAQAVSADKAIVDVASAVPEAAALPVPPVQTVLLTSVLPLAPSVIAATANTESVPTGPAADSGFASYRPLAARRAPMARNRQPDPNGPYPRLTWLMFIMALMLIIRYFVPSVAREVSYGVTQGRQRAQQEFATVALRDSPLAELSRAYQWVSQCVGPSVVHINISGAVKPSTDDLLFPPNRRFPETRGQGSGVIMDRDGYIVTNQHVIDGAEAIYVSLSDGRRVRAGIVGVDPLTDLAVLRIQADNLIPAEWGESEDLEVGSLVWAVGSPFGLEQSVTSGIVSAKNRSGRAGRNYQDFLQTDAAVNPGNSGGPLVDIAGRVVGINTAIVGDTYRGISFAIPSSVAHNVYSRLKRDGEVARGWLGVQLVDMDEDQSPDLGLTPRAGAYVAGFVEEDEPSPARLAGLRIGDVVVRWNEVDVPHRAGLSRLIARSDVGSRAQVVVDRDGVEVALEVILSRRPARYH